MGRCQPDATISEAFAISEGCSTGPCAHKLGASVYLKGGIHWMEAKSTSVVGGFISIELKSKSYHGEEA